MSDNSRTPLQRWFDSSWRFTDDVPRYQRSNSNIASISRPGNPMVHNMNSASNSSISSMSTIDSSMGLRSLYRTPSVSSRSSGSLGLQSLFRTPSVSMSGGSSVSRNTAGTWLPLAPPSRRPSIASSSPIKTESKGLSNKGLLGISLGTSAITGAFHLGSGIVQANATKYAINKQAEMQDKRLEFTQKYIDDRNAAYDKVGLPQYLSYGGMSTSYPTTTQMAGGANPYHARIPGNPQSNEFNGSLAQISNGWGDVFQ